jgi:sulfate adenylyltransferase subunit 2
MITNKRLKALEEQSIYIIRTAYRDIKNLCLLWSIGKDSTVLLWLARKAFLGTVPLPLIHIDTGYKIPMMIEYRDRLAKEWKLDLRYGINLQALRSGIIFPNKNCDRLTCCRLLKTEPLKRVLAGKYPLYKYDVKKGSYKLTRKTIPFRGVILGIRADEEGSRSKERYFSKRNKDQNWLIGSQPPDFWEYANTELLSGETIRVHPLLDWTELDVWQYIKQEKIKTVSLYYDQGLGTRYRSLGCYPCTKPIKSKARTVDQVIAELSTGMLAGVPERAGRAQDLEDHGGLEKLRREGYM